MSLKNLTNEYWSFNKRGERLNKNKLYYMDMNKCEKKLLQFI